MNDTLKNILIWVGVALILIVVFSSFGSQDGVNQAQKMPTSTFLGKVNNNQIKSVEFDGQNVRGVTSSGQNFKTYMPWNDPFLLDKLMSKDVSFNAIPPKQEGFLSRFIIGWLPFIIIIAIWIYIMRQVSGGKGGGGRPDMAQAGGPDGADEARRARANNHQVILFLGLWVLVVLWTEQASAHLIKVGSKIVHRRAPFS